MKMESLLFSQRREVCFRIYVMRLAPQNSDIFLLEGCADGVCAACCIARSDVYSVCLARAVAVVINTVCNVARNAAVLLACFASGFICAESIFFFKFHLVIFRIRKIPEVLSYHICAFLSANTVCPNGKEICRLKFKNKNFEKY